ncbi:hypothetical protein ES703_115088 [subsurface metagenome]
MTRKSIWLKLIITDVIMGVCIVGNGYWYIQHHNSMSLLAIAVAGFAIVFATCAYFLLLRKHKNVLR